MRLLVVTPVLRQYGPAMRSWAEAIRYTLDRRPGWRLDHWRLFGEAPGEEGHDRVTAKFNEAREVFLGGTWDAMVTLEDDILVPLDTFERLVALLDRAAIGYGLYTWRHGLGNPWSAYTYLDEQSGRSVSKAPAMARDAWGHLLSVEGVGNGCTIFRRDVLERFGFERRGPACCDWYIALDAKAARLAQVCDLGLVCGHMTLEPSPRVIWPDPEAEGLRRVELLP